MPNQKLYAMRDTATGYVKIGISKYPQTRAYQLSSLVKSDVALILEQEVKNAFVAERYAHRELSEKQVSGEWFALGDADVQELAALFDAAKELEDLPPLPRLVGSGVAKWTLTDYMERHAITPYRLAKVVEQHASAQTIYGLVRKGQDVSRVDLGTLAFVLDGLRELTGENVQVTDLISYTPDN